MTHWQCWAAPPARPFESLPPRRICDRVSGPFPGDGFTIGVGNGGSGGGDAPAPPRGMDSGSGAGMTDRRGGMGGGKWGVGMMMQRESVGGLANVTDWQCWAAPPARPFDSAQGERPRPRGLGGGDEREGNTALDWSCFDGAVMRDRCDLRYWLFFFLREIEIGPMIMITNINRIPKIDNDSVIKSAMELPSG